MKANELRAKNGEDLQKELNELLKAQADPKGGGRSSRKS